MGNLIKMSKAAAVSAHSWDAPAPSSALDSAPVESEADRLRLELAEAAAALTLADARVADLEAQVAQAAVDGRREGRALGLGEGQERVAMLEDRLQRGIESALQRMADNQAAMEMLAGRLAITCLDKVLDDSADLADLVLSAIRRHVGQLNDQSLLRVEVAVADFPRDEALTLVAQAVGPGKVEVCALAELASGECRFKLTLGSLEIGPAQQWARLREVLDSLVPPESGA